MATQCPRGLISGNAVADFVPGALVREFALLKAGIVHEDPIGTWGQDFFHVQDELMRDLGVRGSSHDDVTPGQVASPEAEGPVAEIRRKGTLKHV